jgi:hypothetical protein
MKEGLPDGYGYHKGWAGRLEDRGGERFLCDDCVRIGLGDDGQVAQSADLDHGGRGGADALAPGRGDTARRRLIRSGQQSAK